MSEWSRVVVVGLALSVIACSPVETGSSTSTSTTLPVTTTTVPDTTTSAHMTTITATTLAPTTTGAPTTTTASLEGNWADAPLVTTEFGALGWWDGSGWLDAETEGALPVVGGEDYQVVRLGELSRTTGGPQTTVCPPLESLGVELAHPELLGEFPGPYGVAISAPWELQPHLFEEIADDGTYSGHASRLLAERGLTVANPHIKQLFHTDLEGDGVNEVLVVAEDVTTGFLLEPGDYSISFMRKVVEGEVQTVILGETVVKDESDRFSGSHFIGGMADLNGDGKMEIITNTAYFEGFDVTAWEYSNDDLGPVAVLLRGCGS